MPTETENKPELQAAPLPVDRPHPDAIDSDGDNDAHGHGHEEVIPKDLPKVGGLAVTVAIVVFVALLVALFLIGYVPHERRESAIADDAKNAAGDKPVVNVVKPTKQTSGTNVYLPGDVQALQQTMIYPRANGYMDQLKVDIGDKVKAGQLLAVISTPEVDAQLAQAKASAEAAQANIAKAQNDFDLAKTTLERYQGFAKSGGVTQQDLDTRQSAFTQAQSTLANTKASLASAQADVQRLTATQGFQKVYAPFDGVITARNYDIGALLSQNSTTPMFGIAQSDTLRVFVNVPQSYATQVKVGQDAQLYVVNYPAKPFTGKVARSTDSLDPNTRTIKFQVNFPNPNGDLYAGMYGQVKFEIKPTEPPMTVPTSALIFNASGLRVCTVVSNKAHFVKVTTGSDFGTDIEITSGLKGDDQIVSNPGELLTEGGDVQIIQPKAAPAQGGQAGGQNAGGTVAPGDETKKQVQASGQLEGAGGSQSTVGKPASPGATPGTPSQGAGPSH